MKRFITRLIEFVLFAALGITLGWMFAIALTGF